MKSWPFVAALRRSTRFSLLGLRWYVSLNNAKAFICSIEEAREREGKMPPYYKRLVDATLTIMRNTASADNFLEILNQCHSSIKFIMEMESNSMLPFLGIQKHTHVETKVYVKTHKYGPPTTLQEPCRWPMQTWVIRNYAWSSISNFIQLALFLWRFWSTEIVAAKASDQPVSSPIGPHSYFPHALFKNRASADVVRAHLKDLSQKIQTTVQPVFVSQTIGRDLKLREAKPSIVN